MSIYGASSRAPCVCVCTQLRCTFRCRAVLLLGVSNARRADDCCSCINWYFFLAVCPVLACRQNSHHMLLSPHTLLSLPACRVSRVHVWCAKSATAICQNPNWRRSHSQATWRQPTRWNRLFLWQAMAAPPAPCQSQIGHFANRQVTNWAADAAARPDPFEIEARSPRRVMVVQGGVEHRGGELQKLNHFIITVFSQGSSRFLGNRGSQCKRM